MSQSGEDQKDAIVEQAAGLAAGHATAISGDARAIRHFVHAFYQHVPAADVVARAPSDLSEAALSLWRFAAERQPGRPKIRVLSPSGAEEAWIGGRTILQVVNDDMPFLMDSVTAALTGLGFDVQLVIHPVLSVQRDGAGRLTSCGPDVIGGTKESMLHVELAGDADNERYALMVGRLETVLADVRSAVEDLAAMGQLVEQAAQEVESIAQPGPVSEAGETAGFLRWLTDDNFHFFGSREYAVSESGLGVVHGSGKGLLRSDAYLVFDGLRTLTQVPPDLQAFLRSPQLIMVSKSNRRSTVHRPVPMDAILIKKLNKAGEIAGLRLLLGLFTAASYLRPPREIPVLRDKVRRCQERSGFARDSRDARALQHILDRFPRDELFQTDEEQLFETALGILHLQQRPRVALFVLRDPFERFVTCIVYMPRDRYNAEIRSRMAAILEQAFNASLASDSTHFDEHRLARIHFALTTTPGQVPDTSAADVERRLVEAARAWIDRLSEAVVRARGAESAPEILRRFRSAFPANYVERFRAEVAVEDIKFIEEVTAGAPIAVSLWQMDGTELRLKTFHLGEPVALSDVLPMLENLGLRVVNEIPFEVTPRGAGKSVWIQEIHALLPLAVDIAGGAGRFEEALRQIWTGMSENDGFNRLVLLAGLSARAIVVLRTYCKILRQAGSSFSQAYMEDTASTHPHLARLLVQLFEAQFDPARGSANREAEAEAIQKDILERLEQVENLDEDRILRGFLLLIRQTLRTNFYQRDAQVSRNLISR